MQKIIHYFYDDVDIWKKGTSSTFRICFKSWLQKCPDYKIMLWHDKMPEFQTMLQQSRFLRECYKRKMWAFIADYVRYYALYNYGGIYLDTDVELLKNFDEYLDKPFFCSIEGDILYGENIPEPAVMGGETGHIIFKEVLDLYNSAEVFKIDNFIANVILQKVLHKITDFHRIKYSAEVAKKAEKYHNPQVELTAIDDIDVYKNQKIYKDETLGIYIYPSEYFCPSWESFGLKAFTDKTVAIHWNQSSWWKFNQSSDILQIRALRYDSKLKRFIYMHSDKIAKILTYPIFIKQQRKKLRKKLADKLNNLQT